MINLIFSLCLLALTSVDAISVPNLGVNKDAPQVDLPENWDQTKDDTQSLFLNKNDKNDLEPYPLALSDDASADTFEPDRSFGTKAGMLEGLVMRPELFAEPPALSYDRLYGTLERRKRSGASKHAAPVAKDKTVNSNSLKETRSVPRKLKAIRQKRDSDMSSADILALLSLWEAQERRRAEQAQRFSHEQYYNHLLEEGEDEPADDSDVWYSGPVAPAVKTPPHPSYFSDQNRFPSTHVYRQMYDFEPDAMQRVENERRKRQWAGFANGGAFKHKRFMVAKKSGARFEGERPLGRSGFTPRDDLYTLAALLKAAPRNPEGVPVYRRFVL